MRLLAAIVGVLVFLTGCVTDPYPPYKLSSLDFDDELVGVWRSVENEQNADDAFELRFSRRPITVVGDRLPTSEDSLPWFGKRRQFEQYIIDYAEDDGVTMRLLAFLLDAEDSRLLGIQLDGEGSSPFLNLPVHAIMKLERDGDDLTLWTPEMFVVWLPDIEPVDGPEDPGRPIPDRESDAMMRVTSSIDRLASYYMAHVGDAAFWTDEPMLLRRVTTGEPAD